MSTLIRPGLLFQAAPLPCASHGDMEPTSNIEAAPKRDATYVVCLDGSIKDFHDQDRPIGWELIDDGESWLYRVINSAKPLQVFFRGNSETIPTGGSVNEPQCAEIINQADNDIEVISKYNPSLAAVADVTNGGSRSVCTG